MTEPVKARDVRGRARLLASLVVSAGLVLAACSGDAPASESPALEATTVPAATPTQTPAPALTPSPTATAPTPTATAVADGVPANDLAAEAAAFLETFTRTHSPRESATDQELAAALTLQSHLEGLGYRTFLQDFEVRRAASEVAFSVGAADSPVSAESLAIHNSAGGEATALLAHVGLALAEDIPAAGLEGRIALIERGAITFQEKVERVAQAGAVAALIFNSESGLFRGSMTNPSAIPAVGIARETGLELLDLMASGEVEATVSVLHTVSPSRNVVAEKPGTVEGSRVVVIGAHYDTVAGVEGANDNGSGVTTVVTIATQIASAEYPFTVRFVLFGSEELGLVGSSHYVDELSERERADTIAMLNFDVPGSGTTLEALGDEGLRAAALASSWSAPPNVGSDHVPFAEAGIPVLIIVADDVSRIHTPDDRVEFVDPNLIGWAAEIAIALLDHLAAAP